MVLNHGKIFPLCNLFISVYAFMSAPACCAREVEMAHKKKLFNLAAPESNVF